jgi:hypothetical protein
MRIYISIIFYFLVSFSAYAANTGFLVSDYCFVDTADALQEYNAQFPMIQGTIQISIASSSISATGIVTQVTKTRALTTATWTTNPSSTVQLMLCDPLFNHENSSAILLRIEAFASNASAADTQRNVYLSSIATSVASVSSQVSAANPSGVLDAYPINDILLAFALVMSWAFGLQAGLHR